MSTGPVVPRSTYRLQVRKSFDLPAVAATVDYLVALGADWVYLSPVLQAEQGSDHGYDVTDHDRVDADRGGDAGLALAADAAHQAGLGVLVDIVPNHVGVATPQQSAWWWDLLTHGRKSRHAKAFDIDWDFGGGRVRIPVLGDGEAELDALEVVDGTLRYYDHILPIAPGTGEGSAREVHDKQHYELVGWRRADAELNYRRFFAVNTLAGIRVEDPEVFVGAHTAVIDWFRQGWADGLRIDHPDGLRDPAGYLKDLAAATGHPYVLVEKILEGPEPLPAEWACAGTTGYDALADFDRVLVDPSGEKVLTALDNGLRHGTGDPAPNWADLIHGTKRSIADGILGSEVARLARLVPQIPDAADAVAEMLSCFPVYRSYLSTDTASPTEDARAVELITETLQDALRRRPDLHTALYAVAEVLADPETEFALRFQQTSGMVMAKGVEDTAFYRYSRLTSLTEVGADPAEFSVSPEEFHHRQQRRLSAWPQALTSLSTHDTKRSEDTRARVHVLAEIGQEWAEAVTRWTALAPLPDGGLANLLLQAAVGTWPISRERMHAYAEKAAREAGESTNWFDPDADFENQMHALVDALFDNSELRNSVEDFVRRITPAGRSNSLALKVLQLTAPGVPDVYQGTELWDHSLVDPDNRRPVDLDLRRELLSRIDAGWLPPVDDTGAAKLLITARALRLRRDRPELFGSYSGLTASGAQADHVIAADHGGAISVVSRFPVGLAAAGGWGDTSVDVGGSGLVDVFTGRRVSGRIDLATLFENYPVALLVPDEKVNA